MYIKLISDSIGVALQQVKNTIKLIEEGATVPFISRYRKEATGNLDEVKVAEIKELVNKRTPITVIAKQYNVSRRTVYNYLNCVS